MVAAYAVWITFLVMLWRTDAYCTMDRLAMVQGQWRNRTDLCPPRARPFYVNEVLNQTCPGTATRILLSCNYPRNFYHFTAQCLVAALQLLRENNGESVEVRGQNLPHWTYQLLQAANVTTTLPQTSKCYLRTLSASFDGCLTSGDDIVTLAQTLVRNSQPCKPVHHKRIFVSREHQLPRAMLNRGDVSMLLRDDFGVHEVSRGTLQEQICEWNNADVVVGEHGAALTGVMFMKPGAYIVEVTPSPLWTHRSYRELAFYKNVTYNLYTENTIKHPIVHGETDGWPQQRIDEQTNGYTVSISNLRAFLRVVLL